MNYRKNPENYEPEKEIHYWTAECFNQRDEYFIC